MFGFAHNGHRALAHERDGTAWECTPWHAVQRAAWEALDRPGSPKLLKTVVCAQFSSKLREGSHAERRSRLLLPVRLQRGESSLRACTATPLVRRGVVRGYSRARSTVPGRFNRRRSRRSP